MYSIMVVRSVRACKVRVDRAIRLDRLEKLDRLRSRRRPIKVGCMISRTKEDYLCLDLYCIDHRKHTED
jgi:hypothetical protein